MGITYYKDGFEVTYLTENNTLVTKFIPDQYSGVLKLNKYDVADFNSHLTTLIERSQNIKNSLIDLRKSISHLVFLMINGKISDNEARIKIDDFNMKMTQLADEHKENLKLKNPFKKIFSYDSDLNYLLVRSNQRLLNQFDTLADEISKRIKEMNNDLARNSVLNSINQNPVDK